MLALVVSEVHCSLWLFEPRKGYGAAQSSTSMELWVMMDLDLYASDIIGKAQFEKVYWGVITSGLLAIWSHPLYHLHCILLLFFL